MSHASPSQRGCFRLLIVNPNSSEDMTHAMERAIASMGPLHALDTIMYTAPATSGSPTSINDADDIERSTCAVWTDLCQTRALDAVDGVLIACYSSHPLVGKIASHHPKLAVTGIFEASIAATLPLLRRVDSGLSSRGGWGIVTTGKFWEAHLTLAVHETLGSAADQPNAWFRGVFSTGLNAGDFHGHLPPEMLRDKLTQATRKLLQSGNVDCVIMGCAGMAGLEEIIWSTVKAEYGEQRAKGVYILDGLRAGVEVLQGMVRMQRLFLHGS
ncbi:Asp/Glu/Hydantoin racemase-domain-containing protein [Coniella lustricola]|uniref:Asp/Glu/Hydantoin racemase-domain-containing protein n=1 Tax=Coniella lustricola TaxID=2025994 RepID=A0A2T3A6R9_9PEZI|nr:Asp/Glu/Hydantoin racemase-domain-containing protein [Coniella lustricola]